MSFLDLVTSGFDLVTSGKLFRLLNHIRARISQYWENVLFSLCDLRTGMDLVDLRFTFELLDPIGE